MGALVARSKAYNHNAIWTNADNALRENTAAASTVVPSEQCQFYGFDFSDLPASVTVTGISLRIDGLKDHAGGSGDLKFSAVLSWDGGTSWSSELSTPYLDFGQVTFVVGGVDQEWGHTPWTRTQLVTANEFRVRLEADYDSIVSTPTWFCAYLTATVHYDADDTPADTGRDTVQISERVVSSILHDVVYEKIGISDSGSQSTSAPRKPRGIDQVTQSGTAVTLLDTDAGFNASAERPKKDEAIGAAIQLGIDGPTVFVGDAVVTTENTQTYPYSYFQAGLLDFSDLTSEATFLEGFLVTTVEVKMANKDYVDQSDGTDLVPKTISEHSLGLPSVGRSMIVWIMVQSGDGWKKRVVFNGEIEDIQFRESEVIFRGVQVGTTQKAVPDIVVDENLFTYEPGSSSEDTGEQIEENKGKVVPIGIGRFDYGAVKKPADFPAGHPFRFTAEPGPPAEDLRTYSHIALFPAMMGLKHPMMPTIHVARRYRRVEGNPWFHSWPWQNVLLYGSRKSTPALSVSVGSTNPGQTFALQSPNWDTRTVTDHALYNADRYVLIWTWHQSDFGSRGTPCVKPISDAMYTHANVVPIEDFASLHSSAGTMEQLGYPHRSDVWSDGTALDAYGIFLNIRSPGRAGLRLALPKQWPDVWQTIALQMAGLTTRTGPTWSIDQKQFDEFPTGHEPPFPLFELPDTSESPAFETQNTDDPENCIRLDQPESFSRINAGGSLSLRLPIDGPNLGSMRLVKICLLWNSTTSAATKVQLLTRFAPFSKYGIIDVASGTDGADYNLNKNVQFNTTDFDVPCLTLSGVTDRAFASLLMSAYHDPYTDALAQIFESEPKVFRTIGGDVTIWPPRKYKGEWSFLSKDHTGPPADVDLRTKERFDWGGDVMIKAVGGQFDLIACWLEVAHLSKLSGDGKEPLVQEYIRENIRYRDAWRRRAPSTFTTFRSEQEYTRPNARLTTESKVYVTGKGLVDQTGELTGAAGTIVENPADICNALIRHYLGQRVFADRATGSTFGSFDTARTLLNGAVSPDTYRMTVVVNPDEQIPIKQVLTEIGRQAKAVVRERLDDNGNPWQWIMYVDDPDPATNDTARVYTGFTNNLIRWDNMAPGTFSPSFVPYEDLASSITLRYGFHLATGTWSNTMFCTPDATNFAVDAATYKSAMEFAKIEYRVERQVVVDAPDIWDPVVAEDLCKWHCNLRRRRRLFVEFETYANAFDLEPGHVIKFDDEIGDRIAYPGEGSSAWSAHQFNVEQVSSQKSTGQLARVFVRALEVHAEP